MSEFSELRKVYWRRCCERRPASDATLVNATANSTPLVFCLLPPLGMLPSPLILPAVKSLSVVLSAIIHWPTILLICSVYVSSSVLLSYFNFLLSINSKKHIDNNYFEILQLCVGLPTNLVVCRLMPNINNRVLARLKQAYSFCF
jgi:hypothetical protein